MKTHDASCGALARKPDWRAGQCLRSVGSWIERCPVTTVTSALAVLALVSPGLMNFFVLDFESVAAGEWWRLVSGHVTHYSGSHLFWDLLMFVVLGAACERQHPRRYGVVLLVMALTVSGVVMLSSEPISQYRGLSGIDSGLFVWFIADQFRTSLAERDRLSVAFWLTAAMLLVGKLVYEWVTGEILFVDADGFRPLVESHLAGAACSSLILLALPNPVPPVTCRADRPECIRQGHDVVRPG